MKVTVSPSSRLKWLSAAEPNPFRADRCARTTGFLAAEGAARATGAARAVVDGVAGAARAVDGVEAAAMRRWRLQSGAEPVNAAEEDAAAVAAARDEALA